MEYTRTRGDAEAPHIGPPEWRKDRHGWWLYREGSNRRKGVQKTCATCGTEFMVVHSDAEKRKVCSRRCAALIASHTRDANRRRRGAEHPNWRGGRHVRKRDGYVQIHTVSETGERKWQLEHRLVMAEHLGRPLLEHETVHHKNGDKGDNRLENLELRVGRHGRGATEPHCATCTCFD